MSAEEVKEVVEEKEVDVFAEAAADGFNLTAVEAAEKFDYHPLYMRKLAATGKVDAIKPDGRLWRISEESVQEYVDAQAAKKAEAAERKRLKEERMAARKAKKEAAEAEDAE